MANDFLYPNEPLRFGADNLDALLKYCSDLKASDITFQTNEKVFAEITGFLYSITKRKLSAQEVGDIINYLYGPNGTTQLLSGTDVDTYYEFRPSRYERFRYRVNGTACQVEGHNGIQITLRTIPIEPPKLETLDLPPKIIDVITPQNGVVYVTGPTGSGKTTLLASVIRYIAENENCHRKILTYEAPIEFVYDMLNTPSAVISQSEIPRHLPSFAAGVRNALRRKPRLILVGEARDSETITAVIDAALTGHPVYTTLHTVGVPETVRRLVGSFSKEEREGKVLDIIETLRLIVCQRLLPTVDGKQVAIREYMYFDEKIRETLLNEDLNRIVSVVRKMMKDYGTTFLEDATDKFKVGILPEKEYQTILRAAGNAV